MSYLEQPMGISRVVKHREFDNILTITDTSGQDWHYLQQDSGALILGFPIQLYKPGESDHIVHVFHPLGPGGIPVLLRVTHV